MKKKKNSKVYTGSPLVEIQIHREIEKILGRTPTPLNEFDFTRTKDWGDGVRTFPKNTYEPVIFAEIPLKLATRVFWDKIGKIFEYYQKIGCGYKTKKENRKISYKHKKINALSQKMLEFQQHNKIVQGLVGSIYGAYLKKGLSKRQARLKTLEFLHGDKKKKICGVPPTIWGFTDFAKRAPYPTTEGAIRKIVG